MKSRIYRYFIVFFFVALMMSGCRLSRQVNETTSQQVTESTSLQVDSLSQRVAESPSLQVDSLSQQVDETMSQQVDSLSQSQSQTSEAEDPLLEDKIERSCNDSTVQDFKNNKIYYYGDAKVVYEDITIEAAFIEFDFDSRTVFAKGMTDSTGRLYGTPVFTESDKKYNSETMTFNFETKKGIITKVFTEDAMGYIHGTRIKKMDDNTINIKSGSYTTCSNPEHPHFEFHFGKAKVIPDDA